MSIEHIIKEFSWLSFNERVLQEAKDPSVPLIERLKFLGIFSSNRDEFFRVRVATIQRLSQLGLEGNKLYGVDPKKVLKKIQEIVLYQNSVFVKAYENTIQELANNKIYLLNEKELTREQGDFVKEYFQREVRPKLIPIMLDNMETFPDLEEKTIYLVIVMSKSGEAKKPRYSLIEVPTDRLSRFIILPQKEDSQYIILLDDVIRYGLSSIFLPFDFDSFSAYTIKLTRDADLDIDDDLSESLIKKVHKSLKQRREGNLVRFTYDSEIPEDLLQLVAKRLHFAKDDAFIPGRRYHNNKDLMNFPKIGPKNFHYKAINPLPHKDMERATMLIEALKTKDLFLHFPYQSFDHFIDLLREAAIDPKVVSIKITLYRVAKNSNVINALVNAIKNGKSVTAVVELQARFDEEANIYWANELRDEGARVIYGVPGLKVHAKLCLITRKERGKMSHYATLGTGNFNEVTSRIYTDHLLLTSDKRLTNEVVSMFEFFENNYKIAKFKHLAVSPFYLRKKIFKYIDTEILNAVNGKEAFIHIKVNNFSDSAMSEKIRQAANAGVRIRLIVRGMCSHIPEFIDDNENIEAISIVDKFLEHSRIFVFCNDGNEKYFISSADLMTRNLEHRVEVACPIYDDAIKKELRKYFDIQWDDNVKARIINHKLDNEYRTSNPRGKSKSNKSNSKSIRSQEEIYRYLKKVSQ